MVIRYDLKQNKDKSLRSKFIFILY